MRKRLGFTLVELMVTMAIIAILALMPIVQWNAAKEAAHDSEVLSVARTCSLAAQVYYASNGMSYEDLSKSELLDIVPTLDIPHIDISEVVSAPDGFTMSITGTITSTTYIVTEQRLEKVVPD